MVLTDGENNKLKCITLFVLHYRKYKLSLQNNAFQLCKTYIILWILKNLHRTLPTTSKCPLI